MSSSVERAASSISFWRLCPGHRGSRHPTCSPVLARRARLTAMPPAACRIGAVLLLFCLLGTAAGTQPAFETPLLNMSVPKGRDATFSCVVTHLGGYRVGWVKADTKAIQAIHTHVITHNQRVTVSHSDRNTWMLHIRGVQEEDRGPYMCQINTDPMKSQIGYLEVTVPPEIMDDRSSNDVMVPEGSMALLKCRAKGHPKPTIIWQREDQKPIVLRTKDPQQPKVRRMTYEGEVLNLTKITRSEMGPYLCIANNSVPPIVSKRIMVEVHFTPVIHVPNQLIGAPPNSSVRLECNVEASPKSIQYWTRDTGEMLITNDRYNETETHSNYYVTHMTLVINQFLPEDEGTYYCTAKNSLGEVQGDIKVYAIKVLTKAPPIYDYKDDLDEVEGDLGHHHTPEITNEIPYGPYSWEGTSPSHLDDVNSHHGYVTHPRTNQRPPSEPSLVADKKKDKGGGRDVRPSRPPHWGWNHSNSSLGVQTCVAFSSILVLCSVLLALLITHSVI